MAYPLHESVITRWITEEAAMAVVNSRVDVVLASPDATEQHRLFKPDRPRHIDRFISFFGDEDAATDDVCGERLFDAFSTESWSVR